MKVVSLSHVKTVKLYFKGTSQYASKEHSECRDLGIRNPGASRTIYVLHHRKLVTQDINKQELFDKYFSAWSFFSDD